MRVKLNDEIGFSTYLQMDRYILDPSLLKREEETKENGPTDSTPVRLSSFLLFRNPFCAHIQIRNRSLNSLEFWFIQEMQDLDITMHSLRTLVILNGN